MSVILQGDYVVLTDGTTVATDASLGDVFFVSGLATRSFSNPTNPTTGQLLTYVIENTGASASTAWGSAFHLAGARTEPLPDRARSITFFYDGVKWVEITRTGADLKLIASDPTDVASLVGWWEAADIAQADASAVTTWPSRVAGNLVAPSGNEPTFKTAIQNGRPIVRFDGTNDYLSVANPLRTYQSCSVFAVFAKGDIVGTGLRTLADFAGTGPDSLIIFENTTTANCVQWDFGSAATFDKNVATSVGTAFHQWSWTVPTGGTPKLYKDAGSAITPTSGLTATFAAVAQASLYVGNQNLQTRYMNGDLAELLVYSTSLSDADRAVVATYLKNKWGTP